MIGLHRPLSAGSALPRRVPRVHRKGRRVLSVQQTDTRTELGFRQRGFTGTLPNDSAEPFRLLSAESPRWRRTANVPLVLRSTGADGYDMDYADSKSIRPRSMGSRRISQLFLGPFMFTILFLLICLRL